MCRRTVWPGLAPAGLAAAGAVVGAAAAAAGLVGSAGAAVGAGGDPQAASAAAPPANSPHLRSARLVIAISSLLLPRVSEGLATGRAGTRPLAVHPITADA